MRSQRVYVNDGRELTEEDLSITSEQGGSLMDQAISELFRLQPKGASVSKGVVPYGSFKSNGTDPQSAGIITSSGSANSTLYVYPFRAMVGAIAAADGSPEIAWTRTRTVVVAAPTGATLQSGVVLGATDGTHSRCDLVYCKVTLAAASANQVRYLRDPASGIISAPTILTEISDAFTLGVQPGTPFVGTAPVRPSLPADSGADYYIPLAYVFLPIGFTGGTTILNKWIHEIAPVLPIARATGAASLRVASWQNKAGSPILSADDFNTATGGHRAIGYLPTTLVGEEKLLIVGSWNNPTFVPALNTTNHIVDDSVDWRRRLFWWTAAAVTGIGALPWDNGGPVNGDFDPMVGSGTFQYGQSFRDDGTGAIGQAGGVVGKNINPGGVLASSPHLYVNLSDGTLRMKISNVSPNGALIVRLEATGQFANSS